MGGRELEVLDNLSLSLEVDEGVKYGAVSGSLYSTSPCSGPTTG